MLLNIYSDVYVVVLFLAHCHHVFLGMLIIVSIKNKIKKLKKAIAVIFVSNCQLFNIIKPCGKSYYGTWPPWQHLDLAMALDFIIMHLVWQQLSLIESFK